MDKFSVDRGIIKPTFLYHLILILSIIVLVWGTLYLYTHWFNPYSSLIQQHPLVDYLGSIQLRAVWKDKEDLLKRVPAQYNIEDFVSPRGSVEYTRFQRST